MAKLGRAIFGLAVWSLMLPAAVFAQAGVGSIAGTVRDTSGGVLPGVTVEATSPALIDKVRTVVTDNAGQYRIVDLRPGTYAVTFTLPGFSPVRRQGIELTTGFTATVNVELMVGAVAETVTVSGETPIVDVQNTQQQVVITREVLDAIPISNKRWQNAADLIPGVTATGTGPTNAGGGIRIHGTRNSDTQLEIDGLPLISWSSIGTVGSMILDGNYQEISISTSGLAESETGGIRANNIPREGGNTFRGHFYVDGTSPRFESDNLSDELRSQGLRDPNKLKSRWRINPGFGGPILRDKLWFYGAYTHVAAEQYVAGSYLNTNPAAWNYVPDLSRRAVDDQFIDDVGLRLTYQASQRNKIGFFYNYNFSCTCHFGIGGANRSDATRRADAYGKTYQLTWSSPYTNRLLFEAAVAHAPVDTPYPDQPDSVAPRIEDTGLGVNYRASSNPTNTYLKTDSGRGSISYVTGTHAAKFGFNLVLGGYDRTLTPKGSVIYRALNGVPNRATYWASPLQFISKLANLGIYAQDQWTRRRLTFNYGVRFDYLRTWYPDQTNPPLAFVPLERVVPGRDAVKWKDLSPRLGVAYDVFGNGKTAVKASINRYVLRQGIDTAAALNPLAANSTNPRAWTDTNGDRIVQGDPVNPTANGELGPSQNLKFGQLESSMRFDEDWANGFGVRSSNWEFSSSVQHELLPRVSVNVGYFRRVYENFAVTPNLGTPPSAWDPYCVTAPADPRLPGGGGQQICGLFDLDPSRVGQADFLTTSAKDFGNQYEHWNGVDLTVSARLAALLLQGGLSTGKTMTDNCDVISKGAPAYTADSNNPVLRSNNPSQHFCHIDTPFLTQIKMVGSYSLPWDFQVSGAFYGLPGPEIVANATFTNAQIAPSLGRNLSSGSTATVNLVAPGTMYGDRSNQLDLRFAKTFNVGGAQIQGLVDLYNALNASAVTTLSSTYGATTGASTGTAWLRPQGTLSARLIKFGLQMDF